MKTQNALILATLISLSACNSQPKTNVEISEETVENDVWIPLLEDNTLDQWEMYNSGEIEGWEVINGELLSSGAGWDANQDLITKQSYGNFELKLEWKITPENSSGIFFYVQKRDDQPIYESAPEYQVMDDKGWPEEMKPNQYTAGNYAMHAAEGGDLKPVGEWNSTKILVNYPHVEHWLNGVKVVEYEFGTEDWQARKAAGKWAKVADYGTATSGRIGLQNAGKVVYRNIKIRELK
jgi:hypothetical protein